jgi:hypothetical protein
MESLFTIGRKIECDVACQMPFGDGAVPFIQRGRTMKKLIVASMLFVAAGITACSKTDTTPVDSALSISPAPAALDSISAVEQAEAPALVAPAPSSSRTSSAPRRTSGTTTRRSSSGTSGSTSRTSSTVSSGGTYTKKNTKRDAAIGAAAGAVIGATTSHDKVKGAVVGGVVGAVVGGVIGNNVDVQKKKK